MNDILIALAFVAMVTCPALVSWLPARETNQDSSAPLVPALTPADDAHRCS